MTQVKIRYKILYKRMVKTHWGHAKLKTAPPPSSKPSSFDHRASLTSIMASFLWRGILDKVGSANRPPELVRLRLSPLSSLPRILFIPSAVILCTRAPLLIKSKPALDFYGYNVVRMMSSSIPACDKQ